MSLESFRKTRQTARRSTRLTQPLVALWFGAAAIAAAAGIWALMGTAMRHGIVGLAVLLTIASVVAWPAAGGYVRTAMRSNKARREALTRHPSSTRGPRG